MNSIITKVKNMLEGTNSRLMEAEECISELKDRMVAIIAEEQNKGEKMKIIEDSFRDFWDNIKCTNIRVTGVPEEKEKNKGTEKIFEEIIVENVPSMGKEISSPRCADMINARRNTTRHMLIKLTEIKHKETI